MTPTDKLSEFLAAATKVQRLAGQYATARSDDDYTAKQCSSARHVYLAALEDFHHVNGEQIIANAAEVIHLRAINTQLVADFNTMNQHGAKQDETIRELRLQLGMANHAEDATRAENAELVAANALLVVRLEKARGMGQQLVDDGECGYEITQRWHTWLTEKDE